MDKIADQKDGNRPFGQEPLIQIEDLFKIYKSKEVEVVALRGLDLTVEEGEIIAIMGPSGCGKTTLLNIIAGLDKPSAGKAIVEGENLANLERDELVEYRKEMVGLIFQFFNLVPTLTAARNIDLPMQLLNVPPWLQKKRRDMLLRLVGMEARGHHLPDEMSGGEQQRVAIAVALANDPPILLADEPTGELDTESGQKVMELFKRLRDKQGKTIIIVTHDIRVSKIADRSLKIKDGQIFGEYLQEAYTHTGDHPDDFRYKRLVESIQDKKERMEGLLKEIMDIESDLLADVKN